MPPHIRPRSAIALLLCLMAALSAAQTSGVVPGIVAADNTINVQLLRSPTSTEPLSANGSMEINLDNGQIKFELRHATPNSVYTTIFVSASANVQIGTFVTDQGGATDGQGTLSSGDYVGVFEVTRLGITQFASASVSFTIGATVSISESETTSTTESSSTTNETTSQTAENTVSLNNTSHFELKLEPASRSITAGDFAKFNIIIQSGGSENIFLVARDVPPGSVAIFTPNVGAANPEFHSTLTVITSVGTPAGLYVISTVASVNGKEFTGQVSLEVSAPSTTSQSATMTVSVSALSVTIGTDQTQYEPNATVNVRGHVTDASGGAVAGAAVSIQIDSPTGAEVFFASTAQTDAAGTFQTQFTLSPDSTLGTYTVFTSATKAGSSSATARSTFVVGSSTTPSVVISAVYAGDSSGNPMSTFTIGQTVWIWIVVRNVGATFQGVIWVQVRDPNGAPVEIRITISNLHAGETVKNGIGFTLTGNAALGVYRVDALVSDKLISQGGTFLANAQAQFALTG